jgi:hypothetical protein
MARPAKRDPVAPPKRRRGNQPVSIHTPLTRLQELFVKELVSKDGQITMREAAINAGFAASGAHTRAYEMTNPHVCPHVVAAIRAYRDELDMKYGINYKRHIRDLQIIRDMACRTARTLLRSKPNIGAAKRRATSTSVNLKSATAASTR